MKLLMDDVAALRPTLFMAVPRILESAWRMAVGGTLCMLCPAALCTTCRACAVVCMLCCTTAAWSIG